MNKILNRNDGTVICEDNQSIKYIAIKHKADLSGADLSGANLSGADLSGADLYGADLYGADLSRADLSGADLSGANLYRANLYRADLSRADLYRAKNIEFYLFPSIRILSSIQLNNLPDNLQTELMRRDASAHPHPEKFDQWANNRGGCPYETEERFWLFEPKKTCWVRGAPIMTDIELILGICKSQGWKIKDHNFLSPVTPGA